MLQRIPQLSRLALVLCAVSASADPFPAGFISWDVIFPGNAGQFDIVNQTGPNSSAFPDTTFPISTTLNLSSLSLSVNFSNSTSETFGSSYFALGPDGISFDGSPIPVGGTNPTPTGATLTGSFSPLSITLNDGSSATISANFSATIAPSTGTTLSDGDFAVIEATRGTGGNVPEPGTAVLIGSALLCLIPLRKRLRLSSFSRRSGFPAIFLVACLAASQFGVAKAAVKLNQWTAPSSGVSGVNNVNVTGSGFPAGTINPANVGASFHSGSCAGAVAGSTTGNSIKTILGTSRRVNISIPAVLATGTYFVSLADSADGAASFTSSGCSEVTVTHTNATLSACLPTSSLAVLAPQHGGTVTTYVPNGAWGSSTTGVQAVNIEGPTSATSIGTAAAVNSCSSNPATGQTVCVSNGTDVYLISGTSLSTTLTSGASGFASFSGGSCRNCGVAINALTNKAVINMGLSGSPSGDGIQMLNLNTNAFEPVIPTQFRVSEDISVDPTRNLILSPNENGNYDVLQIQANGSSVKEFGNNQNSNGIFNFDSAAEDCSTGLALASEEQFPFNVFITDLTQGVFTPGSPAGTWTAPSTNFPLNTAYSFSAATDGISVAPGSGHLAVITGEFGGNTFAALQLPSTSGSGTPTIVDYAVAQIPGGGACPTFSAGLDPHTVTAYTSPNDGKAYAVFANSPPPSCVAVVDLAAVLAATRGGSGLQAHDVSAANLAAAGAIRYVATH